jgi:hypothetical protein
VCAFVSFSAPISTFEPVHHFHGKELCITFMPTEAKQSPILEYLPYLKK